MDLGKGRTWLLGLRPRWAWLCLGVGLPILFLPESVKDRVGCLVALGGLAFTVGLVVLAFVGAGILWRRWLFRVSRRLWMILLLLSFLPALLLTLLFLSVGWLGLGGQVSRTLQASIRNGEAALKRTAGEPDRVALLTLRSLGGATLSRVDHLPEGVEPGFVGLVWDAAKGESDPRVVLRAVGTEGAHFRLVDLPLEAIAEQGRDLWGGRIHYRVDRVGKGEGARATVNGRRVESGFISKSAPPLRAWSVGAPLAGRGLFHPFRLPAVGLEVLDWDSGQGGLLATATPETSLREIWRGYGYDGAGGNRSLETLVIQVALGAVILGLAAFQAVALVAGLVLARQLGKSVDDLFEGVGRLSQGDFAARIRPRTKDQVGRLAQAFNTMAMTMEQSLVERQKRQALEEELRVAREVQMHLLPDIPQLPSGAAVHATILPARDVAGDYYDLFRLSDGRLAFLIADVSGKGTSAAFYAAETKGVVTALDKVKRGPLEVADRLNTIWCEGHSRKVFMTLCYGTFDPATGDYAFVRCGHPPAMLRKGDGSVARLQPRGLGIGMTRTRFLEHLEMAEGRLEPGECLLFFTDGLSEAQGPDQALFGEPRIQEVLASCGPSGLQQALLAAVADFTEGASPEDDLTLLILQRN